MQNFPSDWTEQEVVLKVKFKVKVGTTPYASLSKCNWLPYFICEDIIVDQVNFEGINYGFLQTIKPRPRPKQIRKATNKKIKLLKRKNMWR